ncbi:MAG: hypothetical protein ABIO72_05520 [Patescibacteria group bacterium]
MESRIVFLFFSALISIFAIGCRVQQTGQAIDDGDMTITPTPRPMPEQPDTSITFPRDILQEPIPLPEPTTDDGPPEFISYVYLNAACDMNPESMDVVAGRTAPAPCEHIIALGVVDDHGDTYDVGCEFDWSSAAAADISISCKNSPHDDFCWAVGHHDVFDSWNGNEPSSFVMACVNNVCANEPPDCQPIVCNSVVVHSIVNLEGTWANSWASAPENETLTFIQDGRLFKDPVAHAQNGTVYGTHVTFNYGDYLFEGDLLDRNTITGNVTELMTDTSAGSWTMTRVMP